MLRKQTQWSSEKEKKGQELTVWLMKEWSSFPYQGYKRTEDGKCEEEIKRRIYIVKSAFTQVHNVLTRPQIQLPTRTRILYWFCVVYTAVWSWDIDTYGMNEKETKILWTLEECSKCQTYRVPNQSVLRRVNTRKQFLETIKTNKLVFEPHHTPKHFAKHLAWREKWCTEWEENP